MTSEAAALTEQIAGLTRLLAGHLREDGPQYIACRCGWQHVGGYPTGARPHTTHLAEVLAAFLTARLASRPAVTEAAVEAAAEALIQYETGGCCHLRSICGLCDCFRTPENDAETQARELDRARHGLTAALPHMGDGKADAEHSEARKALSFAAYTFALNHPLYGPDTTQAVMDWLNAFKDEHYPPRLSQTGDDR